MFKTIEGVYRNGNVELSEEPDGVDDGMPVLVTFLDAGKIDLRTRGIDKKQAAELRGRLATFAEEWESPEMDVYDHYIAKFVNQVNSNSRKRSQPCSN